MEMKFDGLFLLLLLFLVTVVPTKKKMAYDVLCKLEFIYKHLPFRIYILFVSVSKLLY